MIDKIKRLLDPEVSLGAKLVGVSMFFARAFEHHDNRISDLEVIKLAKKGEKGDKGDKGDAGLPGIDGKNGIDGKDGRDGVDGKDGVAGVAGKNGKNGTNGLNGVGIVDVSLAADNHLMVSMTDGREIDAGDLELLISGVASQVQVNTQVANPQIIISATAPSPPDPADAYLWYDIS